MLEYWMASNESLFNGTEMVIEEVLQDPGSVVLFVDYPPWLLSFAAGCCILFMFIGIPGNLITVVALFRTKKLRNATAIFIMNLSVSDLMFCCFNLPLATSTFWHGSWLHGPLLCRLFPLLRYGLVAVSLFTVVAITFNRYVMIGHPRLYPLLYRRKYLIPMVLATWLVAFGILIVTWFGYWGRFGLDPAIGSCSILPDARGRSPKEFLFVLAFLAPCIAIVVCYARIFYIVRKTGSKSRTRATGNTGETNEERRSTSPRNQEEELSVPGSSCNTTVFCSSFPRKHRLSARASEERNSSRSTAGETSSANQICPEARKEETNAEDESEVNGEVEEANGTENCSDGTEHSVTANSRDIAEAIGSIADMDDIPYVDDREDMNDCLNNVDSESRQGGKSNNQRRLERMASFVVEPARWVQKVSAVGTEQSETIGSSSLAEPARRNAIARRESRFRGKPRNPETPKMSTKDRKLLKMILVIFSSFLVCYLPITVTKTFKDAIDWRGLNIAGYILIYLTTCINPVIYVVMSSEYRSAYKNLLLCRSESSAKSRPAL